MGPRYTPEIASRHTSLSWQPKTPRSEAGRECQMDRTPPTEKESNMEQGLNSLRQKEGKEGLPPDWAKSETPMGASKFRKRARLPSRGRPGRTVRRKSHPSPAHFHSSRNGARLDQIPCWTSQLWVLNRILVKVPRLGLGNNASHGKQAVDYSMADTE